MILVIDDDPGFLEQVETGLAYGERVFVAQDGESALELMKTVGEGLSVALVDLNLPTVDGFSLILKMRQDFPDLPIIAISGVAKGPVLESAKLIGAQGVLSKPITPEWNRTIGRVRKHQATSPATASNR